MSFRFPSEKFTSREQFQPFATLWLRKIFLEDWSTKLIALAITLALWFGISGQQTPGTRSFSELPLKLRLSNEIDIINEPPRLVEVTLTGDKGKLDRLDKSSLPVTVDLSDRAPGEWLVELKPTDVIMELPSGVKIDEIQPNRFLVKLEKRAEREIEVKPTFEGQLPEGFEVYDEATIMTPAKVRVRGPASFVNSMDSISTESIPLQDQKGDFVSKQVAVNLLNTKITVLDTVVDVSVKIGPKRIERKFTVRTQTPAGANATLTVTLKGPAQALEKFDVKSIRIDWDKVTDQSFKPRATVPDDAAHAIIVENVTPSLVNSNNVK